MPTHSGDDRGVELLFVPQVEDALGAVTERLATHRSDLLE
jgi:hypothetical protein